MQYYVGPIMREIYFCFIVSLFACIFSFQPVGREDSGAIDNTFGLALVSFASNVEGFCVLTWKVTRLEILCKRGI